MGALSNLVSPLAVVLLAAFLGLTLWAAALHLGRRPDVPPAFLLAVNATYALYALSLVIGGLAVAGGMSQGGKFWEYMLVFVGGGVLYMRGLFKGGWLWRLLTDPPKVPWGMLVGAGWCFAAVLGYLFFLRAGG